VPDETSSTTLQDERNLEKERISGARPAVQTYFFPCAPGISACGTSSGGVWRKFATHRPHQLGYTERLAAAMKTSVAIYPGSFDPVTNGHLDLIERGEKMFDVLIVAVLHNAEKQPLFTVPERVDMLREVTRQWASVEVDVFDGLLVDFARKRGAAVILRGIRAVSDYEYELQMALMNRKLEPRLETVFMIPGEPYSYLSAKLVREIAQYGAPLKGLVPPLVEERMRTKMS